MIKTALLFPGQGSQSVGMGKDFPALERICKTAGEILSFDLYDKIMNGTEEELAKTEISQPAIMAVSLAAFDDFTAKQGEFSAVAGHSLGEYAAMVVSEIVSMQDGFKLIKARSTAMAKAAEQNSGAMYAIIGLSAVQIEQVCKDICEDICENININGGYVVPVNYNSPVQTVIAGEREPAQKAAEILGGMGAKAIKLNVAAAFHSKLMQSAADEFYEFAKTISFNKPKVAFFSNVTGGELTDFADMPSLLSKHIVSPVRFVYEIQALSALGYTDFIELGAGKVLTGLVRKTVKS